MRLLLVESDVSQQEKWLESVQPHWTGVIEFAYTSEAALQRLNTPFFFPVMVCEADREIILLARARGVQRFVMKPCEPSQLIEQVNDGLLQESLIQSTEAAVQLQVMLHTLNSLCHSSVTHRQLQWLKQRCMEVQLGMACIAIDNIIRYMDKPGHKNAEVKNALFDLSRHVQQLVDRIQSMQYA